MWFLWPIKHIFHISVMCSFLQLGSGVPKWREPRLGCSCGLSVLCPQCCHVSTSLKQSSFISSTQPQQYHTSPYIKYHHGNICLNSDSVIYRYDVDNLDNGVLPTDKSKIVDKSVEDLSRSASNSPTHSASKASKGFTVRYGQREDASCEVDEIMSQLRVRCTGLWLILYTCIYSFNRFIFYWGIFIVFIKGLNLWVDDQAMAPRPSHRLYSCLASFLTDKAMHFKKIPWRNWHGHIWLFYLTSPT